MCVGGGAMGTIGLCVCVCVRAYGGVCMCVILQFVVCDRMPQFVTD